MPGAWDAENLRMPIRDRSEPAAAPTLAGLSSRRARLLRELQEARSREVQASVRGLEAELLDVERQMSTLIGIDRRAGLFEPRLRLPG